MSKTPPKKTRQQKKEETRELILKKAKQLFLERGYEKTTTRDIAKEAGIAAGTAFAHFPDKISLLRATMYKDTVDSATRAVQTMPEGASAIELMMHFGVNYFKRFLETPELSKVLIKEFVFMKGSKWDQMEIQLAAYNTFIQSLLENAQKNEELHPASDCSILAEGYIFLNSFLRGCECTWKVCFSGI